MEGTVDEREVLFLRERDEVNWFAGGDRWWGILYCVEKQRCK